VSTLPPQSRGESPTKPNLTSAPCHTARDPIEKATRAVRFGLVFGLTDQTPQEDPWMERAAQRWYGHSPGTPIPEHPVRPRPTGRAKETHGSHPEHAQRRAMQAEEEKPRIAASQGGCAIVADVLQYFHECRVDQLQLYDTESEVIQAWENVIHLMRTKTHPTAVWEATWCATLSTAQVYGVLTEDAVEAVMLKVDFRTPASRLGFPVPAQLMHGQALTGEVADAAWKHAKTVTKNHAPLVTHRFHSLGEAIRQLRDHYRRRRAEQCPRRTTTVEEAIRGTCGVQGRRKRDDRPSGSSGTKKLLSPGEIQELLEVLRRKAKSFVGITDPNDITDELGDCLYGVMAYSTAWAEDAQCAQVTQYSATATLQRAVGRWNTQWRADKHRETEAARAMLEKLHTSFRTELEIRSHLLAVSRGSNPRSSEWQDLRS
jgi:NTP pyrophosphatase (non-canonical NTP hydrolase)